MRSVSEIGPRRAGKTALALIGALLLARSAAATAPPLYPHEVGSGTHDAFVVVGGITLAAAVSGVALNSVALGREPWRHHRMGRWGVLAGTLAIASPLVFASGGGYDQPLPGELVFADIVLGAASVILGSTTLRSAAPAVSLVPRYVSDGVGVPAPVAEGKTGGTRGPQAAGIALILHW